MLSSPPSSDPAIRGAQTPAAWNKARGALAPSGRRAGTGLAGGDRYWLDCDGWCECHHSKLACRFPEGGSETRCLPPPLSLRETIRKSETSVFRKMRRREDQKSIPARASTR